MDHVKHLLWLAAAGVSGAFIGLSMHPEQRTPWQRAIYLVSGLLVAFWLSPILCKYFNLSAPEEISAVAFSAGAFWSSIVTKIGQIITAFRMPGNGGK
ncbi:hypothetical protein ACJVQT_22895 [Enterobacter huaxiensis]|uniref:hypothetical protein n=1 Tax=Enterobacter huaxiensis TaxID=2494702 RepID=UPI002175B4EA|nr:hypothetical protein [Enterobacter huaxiensis]MCS5452515.1 hypothetical protein [Enterobacter huaxiensis]